MKRFLVVVLAAVAMVAAAQVERPKLVVGLVVDQMRWDYLYNYQWGEGGFKTLARLPRHRGQQFHDQRQERHQREGL